MRSNFQWCVMIEEWVCLNSVAVCQRQTADFFNIMPLCDATFLFQTKSTDDTLKRKERNKSKAVLDTLDLEEKENAEPAPVSSKAGIHYWEQCPKFCRIGLEMTYNNGEFSTLTFDF